MFSEKAAALKPSGIRKFFDIVSEMPDAVSLGVGEPDFETPWHIRRAGIASLEQGKTFYTSNSGLKGLRQEIAAYLHRTQGLSYDPEDEIIITVGGSEAIDLAMRALINPGDEVIIPEPSYVSYLPCALMAGAVVKTIDLQEKNEFRLQPEELEKAITERSKILVLPFPNNPTGAIMEREDLEKLIDLIIRNDLIVLSDEIYAELTYSGKKHVSIAEFPGMQERTILVSGFSKAFAMTGWRLGYACAPAPILAQMRKIHQYCIMCAPTVSQYAAISAMREGEEDAHMMRESYDERRRLVLYLLRKMGLPVFEPKGAFYIFPCIKEFGMSSEDFATRLLKEEKVAIVPGTAFGDSGEGFLRISYAYSTEALKEALSRLERFITKLRKEEAPAKKTARAKSTGAKNSPAKNSPAKKGPAKNDQAKKKKQTKK